MTSSADNDFERAVKNVVNADTETGSARELDLRSLAADAPQ